MKFKLSAYADDTLCYMDGSVNTCRVLFHDLGIFATYSGLTLLVAGSWLPLLVARGGCLGPPLDISGSYRSIFKIQTAFVSPQHDLHF